jgi:hypothetical protein
VIEIVEEKSQPAVFPSGGVVGYEDQTDPVHWHMGRFRKIVWQEAVDLVKDVLWREPGRQD